MPTLTSFTAHLPVRLLSVGQFTAPANWTHPRRRLDSSVLIVMQRGAFAISIENTPIRMEQGEALLLPAGLLHFGLPMAFNEPPAYCWAHFMQADTAAAPHRLTLPIHTPVLPETVHARVTSLLHQLINERTGAAPSRLACDYLMSLILIELAADRREESRSVAFNRVGEYIRNHFSEELTLSMLSERFGYSEDYLSRLIRANAHMGFRAYLHSFRLERAKRELLGSGKTVKEIASECGYVNVKHFSTVFARSEGMPPTAFRNLYGRQHLADEKR